MTYGTQVVEEMHNKNVHKIVILSVTTGFLNGVGILLFEPTVHHSIATLMELMEVDISACTNTHENTSNPSLPLFLLLFLSLSPSLLLCSAYFPLLTHSHSPLEENCFLNTTIGNLVSSDGNAIASSVVGILLMFVTVAYTRSVGDTNNKGWPDNVFDVCI